MESAVLEATLERLATEALHGAPAHLREAVLYGLLGPGKRIRPRLVLALSRALGVNADVGARLATALEVVHAFTLVHDDLPSMDNDDFRRGRATTHKVYGEGLAVLAGDSLALLAPEILLGLKDALPADRLVALVGALLAAAGARGVIAGQSLEMDVQAGRVPATADGLREVFRLKTGALFRAALEMPAIAAGAPAEVRRSLGELGDRIGIAFQIADDLEDDFAAKRADPAHIAAHLDPERARAEALGALSLPAGFDSRLSAALAPFLDELRVKISGAQA